MKKTIRTTKPLALFGLAALALSLAAWSPSPDKFVKIGTGGATSNFQGFVAGNNSSVDTINANGYACVIGNNHQGSALASVVSGGSHSFRTSGSLVSGFDNLVEGVPSQNLAYYSAAIGEMNKVMATFGWTMGYQNEVTGTRGVAIGCGTNASQSQSTALGRFNAAMEDNDVLAIGSGSDNSNRFTALRVTDSGDVVLGKVQGDISMGQYGN